jgi:hypothetical protein
VLKPKWDWRTVPHRKQDDPERKAAIKLGIVTLCFIASLGVLLLALFWW